MIIREYMPSDCIAISKLFYQTVHSISLNDYSKKELDAWANGNINLDDWNNSFLNHYTLVATENHNIIGFADMDYNGYLDRLYVHKSHQNKGIATQLCNALENKINTNIFTVYASISAKSFFENRGYVTLRENFVVRNGVVLKNFLMQKSN